ncbi:SpoIIE family protein phosphatase [Candidatus Gracilibacteria bacterium]|nr:SpoIIE family protein phosphatase [Candidatus Gracilibacteria bacterium]
MGLLSKIKNLILVNLINFAIILVTLLNIFLVFSFTDILNKYGIIIASFCVLFILIEGLFILFSINSFYDNSIDNLVISIKKALGGNEKIELTKGINPNLNFITGFIMQLLNNFKSIRSDFLKGKEIKSEVELAREIQEKLLNKEILLPPSLNIIAKAKAMGEIGGDSYDVIQNKDNYYIYIGDATGHGVGAGFIMVMVNALISALTKVFISGAQILISVNETLKPRIKANLLMSLLLVRWNEKEKRLFMTGAGHEYLIIYKDKLKKCFNVKSGGLALGMVKDISKVTQEKELQFEENDIIVLYSDGVTDSINSSDISNVKERFGEKRIINAIENTSNIPGKQYKTARGVFNNISVELSKFMGYKHYQVDDITLVVIQYKPNDYDPINDFSEKILEDKSIMTEWKW